MPVRKATSLARAGTNFYNRRADWGTQGNDIRHHLIFSSVASCSGSGKPYLAASAAVPGGRMGLKRNQSAVGRPYVTTQTPASVLGRALPAMCCEIRTSPATSVP